MELVHYVRTSSETYNPTHILAYTLALSSIAMLAFVSGVALPVVLPTVAIIGLVAASLVYLYRIDGQLPVFDLGMLTILMTAMYAVIPPLGFWLAGLQWTELSYAPLFVWNPGPAEVGAFVGREFAYLFSFTSAYLLFRGGVFIRSAPLKMLPPTATAAVVMSGVILMAYFSLLQSLYGFTYEPSYRGLTLASATAAAERVPYFIRQVSHNLFSILFLIKICVLIWLMLHWRRWRWRAVLFVWLSFEMMNAVTRMGARTALVMLLMATGLLYHRVVRPLSFARAALIVIVLLGGALVYGFARDLGAGVGSTGLGIISGTTSSRWATMNEFQAVFGIAYDLHSRGAAGTLGPIPWQIYMSDLLMLVPSQMLPFTKVDPCLGYPIVDGIGLGCVIGLMSQAVIGLDWLELILRGLILGMTFAVIHRWYARRQDDYWATMFYLCLCLWCHYTFRNSTFFVAYYVVYQFLPFLIGIHILQYALRWGARAVNAPAE